MLRQLCWIKDVWRVVSLWTRLVWTLFHIDTSESLEAIEISVDILVSKIKKIYHWFQKMKNGRVISISDNASPLSWSGISFDAPALLLSINEGRKCRVQFTLMRRKQISKMEFLNLRNTWVWFLNVSLKIHADVIAGRQINQTLIK